MHDVYSMMDDLKELLAKDIKTVVDKGDISPEDYKNLDCAIDILKDAEDVKLKIVTTEAMLKNDGGYRYNENVSGMMRYPHMNSMNSYSQGGYDRGNSGNSGMYYDDRMHSSNGNSYARGRSATTGRYVSRDGDPSSRLNEMLMRTTDPQERETIQRVMNEMGW